MIFFVSSWNFLHVLVRSANALGSGVGVALGALWGNKLRATMTTMGIVIGVMTVVGILGVINGLDSSVAGFLDMFGARSVYVSRFPWVMKGRWFKYINRPAITPAQYRRLYELVSFADAMTPMESTRTWVELGDVRLEDVEIRGANSEFLKVMDYQIEFGRFFSLAEQNQHRSVAVLGAELAQQLFPRGSALGRTIYIKGSRYRVVGVYKAKGNFMGQSQDVHVTIPIGRFMREFGLRRSLDIGVRVAAGLSMDDAAEEIRGIMRRVRGLRPRENDDFSINRQEMLGQMYHDMTGTLYLVIVIVGFVSLLVGGISIMNIMMVSVTERTREIGIRKALGARRRAVLFQFLIESLVLSGIGGIIGLAGGFAVAHVVDAVSPLPAKVSLFAVIAGFGFAVAVGLFFGIYPAWRASRLDPIESLRYE